MKFVPATSELIREFYGEEKFPTMLAYVMLDGDKPVAVGGFIWSSHDKKIMFSDAKEYVLEHHKIAVMKLAKTLLKVADANGWELIATADPDISTAEKFLSHLGFVPGENGEYIR